MSDVEKGLIFFLLLILSIHRIMRRQRRRRRKANYTRIESMRAEVMVMRTIFTVWRPWINWQNRWDERWTRQMSRRRRSQSIGVTIFRFDRRSAEFFRTTRPCCKRREREREREKKQHTRETDAQPPEGTFIKYLTNNSRSSFIKGLMEC